MFVTFTALLFSSHLLMLVHLLPPCISIFTLWPRVPITAHEDLLTKEVSLPSQGKLVEWWTLWSPNGQKCPFCFTIISRCVYIHKYILPVAVILSALFNMYCPCELPTTRNEFLVCVITRGH